MTARSSWNQRNTRGRRPRLQRICPIQDIFPQLPGGELLKIEARIECKPSVRYGIVGLIGTGRIGARQFSEVRVVDIQNSGCRSYERPARIVHDIDAIDANLELLTFGNADTFQQIHVETGVRRAFDPLAPKGTDSPGCRIREDNVAVGIGESPIAERTLQRL